MSMWTLVDLHLVNIRSIAAWNVGCPHLPWRINALLWLGDKFLPPVALTNKTIEDIHFNIQKFKARIRMHGHDKHLHLPQPL
eukprot:6517104-Karenia_brevis.AAC.1